MSPHQTRPRFALSLQGVLISVGLALCLPACGSDSSAGTNAGGGQGGAAATAGSSGSTAGTAGAAGAAGVGGGKGGQAAGGGTSGGGNANGGAAGSVGGGSGSDWPSGQAMPVGDLPGWTQVYSDDFLGDTLGVNWFKYNGDIPSMPGGVWDPARVEVSDGKLRLLAADRGDGVWTSGGISNNGGPSSRTYGKWVMRMRMDKASGVKYAGLLWPSSGIWPADGEIDFVEDGGGQRTGTTGTTHYADAAGAGHYFVQRSVVVDMSEWHTVGVEWTPGKLVYTLDGAAWGEVTTPAAAIPDGEMFFALQTEVNTLAATQWMTTVDATTPALVACEVDWFVVYAQN